MTQSYLGALKSYLLAPSFALFGATLPVLRATTLGMALLGALFAMLFARRVLGPAAALASGALLICDASFLLLARHDWGPFAPALLLRCAALWLVVLWWERRRAGWLAAAGFLAGLALWQKADFGVLLAAGGLALLVAAPGALREALREERRALAAAAAAFALGAGPILAASDAVLMATQAIATRGVGVGKLAMVGWTLDGSFFLRVLLGGRMQALPAEAPAALLAPALGLGAVVLAAGLLRRSLPAPQRAGARFVLAGFAAAAAALFALPGATEAHHMLNLYPLPHWIAGAGLASLAAVAAPRGGRPALVLRALGLVLVLAVAISGLRVVRHTLDVARETGGRGRWSHALVELADELADDPDAVVVSLDWGFHEPLLFLTDGPQLHEPFWNSRRPGGRLQLEGDASHLYLVHEARHTLHRLGVHFLRSARAAEAAGVSVREHRSRDGDVAFVSVRIPWPHRIDFDGAFRISPLGSAP